MSSITENYINNWFIKLSSDKMPLSYYLIRKSLLAAVDELKPILSGQVLDLACGVMPYKKYLLNDKIESYIGIDLKPTEYHNTVEPDLYWDGKTIPLKENSVDFVLATEFLEHYFETELILKEIKRVLKTGGIFFFTVPNVWPIHEAPYDYHRFTPFSLTKHFKNIAFKDWTIKALGGNNYHLALSLALRFEKVAPFKKKILQPFINIFIKLLIQRDNKQINLENGELYSGLYGFVTK